MRPRSGGVNCDSIEELLQMEPFSPPDRLCQECSHGTQFSDIDTYLQQQPWGQVSPNKEEYFFDQADQLQVEEEQELSKSLSKDCCPTPVNIGLICSSVSAIYDHLLAIEQVQRAFSQIYIQVLAGKGISVSVEGNVVVIGKCNKSSSSSISVQSLQLRSFQNPCCVSNISVQSRPSNPYISVQPECILNFVTYYNELTLNFPSVNETEHYKFRQYKIWLIQQNSLNSPLVEVYLRRCRYLFKAQINSNQIQLKSLAKVQESSQLNLNKQRRERSELNRE